ncbi:hypothetical protein [Pseudoalteromonas sp. CnMc7-37]|uniref:hypothetical protein n=1 Tax=Pseudoalteromonas sp. CnMc7-37 TaxID=2954496 RepID=UPI0020973C4E|nr:hypothetical protein [Pseudoalteromonas sp. CnMc7-37]MCO7206588.1 hypothetical protein [Pseudoalteromonas sp. CnMc7-37]
MKGSLYSVSDKAMFDAINQSKVTNPELKSLFLSRGVIASPSTKRETLANYFSTFTHGYHDYKRLSDILGKNTRKEKNTSTRITAVIENDDIEAAIESLNKDINSFGAESSVEKLKEGNSYNIKITYQDFNYNNSEFKQVTTKEANILIEQNEDGVVIRHPQNKTVDEWKALLIDKIGREAGKEVPTEDINLTRISDHNKVTEFFQILIKSIDKFELKDVTDVYVYHPKDDEEDNQDENSSVALGTHITKASLKGQNVLKSDVLLKFYNDGFYISKVIWRAQAQGTVDEDIYEFEAQFSNPEEKDEFSYLAKGYYSYISEGKYSKTRKALTSMQERKINNAIEQAAKKALTTILE